MRVGMGYDVHKLVEGRKLILGGVEIPSPLPVKPRPSSVVAFTLI